MQYLIIQIWALIAAGAVVGLIMGWALRGGALGARVRDLRRRMREVEDEAAGQRDEAARLAAELQRAGGDDDQAAEIRRLEFELRDAQAAAARERETAGEMRARVIALESKKPSGGRRAEEGEEGELRDRIAQLEAQLADAQPADGEAARLRQRCLELEAAGREAEALRAQSSADLELIDELRERNDVIQAAHDDLERRIDAVAAGDQAGFADGEEQNRAHWLVARNRWLESKLMELQGGEPASPSTAEAEAIELRARLAEIESARGAASPPEEPSIVDFEKDAEQDAGADDVAAQLARLRWRNQYLTSRVDHLERRREESPAESVEIKRLRERNEELERMAAVGAGAHGLYEELERLRQRLAEFERTEPADESAGDDETSGEENYSLSWRNRYLAARVRFLERRVEDFEAASPGDGAVKNGDGGEDGDEADDDVAAMRGQISGLRAQAEEAARLRARVAELESGEGARAAVNEADRLRARVADLERRIAETRAERSAGRSAPARNEGDYALEWRNRYLTSRVKYLEERLAESRRGVSASDGDAAQ